MADIDEHMSDTTTLNLITNCILVCQQAWEPSACDDTSWWYVTRSYI